VEKTVLKIVAVIFVVCLLWGSRGLYAQSNAAQEKSINDSTAQVLAKPEEANRYNVWDYLRGKRPPAGSRNPLGGNPDKALSTILLLIIVGVVVVGVSFIYQTKGKTKHH